MSEATREQMIRVGVDLPKNVIQVHGVDRSGRKVAAKPIKRDQFLSCAAQLPPSKSPKVLRAALPDVLEDAANELTGLARLVLQRAVEHWRELDAHLQWCDRQIGMHPAGRQSRRTPRSEWSPVERFVSGSAPSGATRPFVDVQSVPLSRRIAQATLELRDRIQQLKPNSRLTRGNSQQPNTNQPFTYREVFVAWLGANFSK